MASVMDRDKWTQHEVELPGQGDLGISVKVANDGAVIVNQLKPVPGYAELLCPELKGGDVLVSVNEESIVDLPFSEVMKKIRVATDSRPMTLGFLQLDTFENAAVAIEKWQESQDEINRLRAGEFDVVFASHQSHGLRFTEGYAMINPLKLAHIEDPMLHGLDSLGNTTESELLGSILVRINEESVLGAPSNDVMALLFDPASFPKTLWLADPENAEQDYHILTLPHREHLKWLCFMPVELMMQVPVVSYAALAVDDDGPLRTTRRDGVREGQYLMEINGVPTLGICVTEEHGNGGSNQTDNALIRVVSTALDQLTPYSRTLRFRDLTEYRRECLAQEPLSPWERRRRLQVDTAATSASPRRRVSSNASTSSYCSFSTASPHELDEALKTRVHYERRGRDFERLLREFTDVEEDKEDATRDPTLPRLHPSLFSVPEATTTVATTHRRPVIKRYNGLVNCEGVRSSCPAVPRNLKVLVIPDKLRHVGIQLETDAMTPKCVVFKHFLGQPSTSALLQPGDVLLTLNDIPVDDIPTDELVRWLQGELYSSVEASKMEKSTRRVQFARPKGLIQGKSWLSILQWRAKPEH
ncbi:hypothetical protein Poli38472_005471 [Pythium oligandrum]|uniref:PDZ domain-containing protein n=1 Tax=Pythium oligandrum TaxID=41045 RepID=A0A8K1CH17_PYTOL|nr:hypothetical protein Poli38472_005471 [Pythium oligandrum]|eukprot:TMW62853.1 hypothetical protein Poli38472_005471 [Pythium oligandrum]